MDVAGAPFEGVEDGGVDQLDNGRDVSLVRSKSVYGKVFVGALVVSDNMEREPFGYFLKNALRLFGLCEKVGNLRIGRNLDLRLLREHNAPLIDRDNLA